MTKAYFFALLLALALGAGLNTNTQACDVCKSDIPTFNSGRGELSYMFFNLSGNACTVTPSFKGSNQNAYSSFAKENGWRNPDIDVSKKTPAIAAFFNAYSLGGSATSPSTTVTDSVIYFNNTDPLNESPVQDLMGNNTYLRLLLNGSLGGYNSNLIYEPSTELGPVSGNESINTPAMGDSWTVACGNGNIVIANMASSSPYMFSGYPTAYPYEGSVNYYPYNSGINPPAASSTPNTPCSVGAAGGEYGEIPKNPCGAGFTAEYSTTGSAIYNWNVLPTAANYQEIGGLWSGEYYGDNMTTNYPATQLLNAPMLPINFSSYVGIEQVPTISATYDYTPVFGGGFTVAVGDPYVISGFAAKALWYIVTNQDFQSSSTTISALQNKLSSASNGVFSSGSVADAYIQWLMGSQSSSENSLGAPQVAANAFMNTYIAAQSVEKKTSIWGKLFAGLADVVVKSLTKAAVAVAPEASVTGYIISSAASTAGGVLIPDMNAAIENAFTTDTSPQPPNSQSAPIVLNSSYGSSNLMGLFLTNSVVSACISNLIDSYNNNTYIPNSTLCSSALLAFLQNYSISTGEPAECDSPSVVNNLLVGSCNNNSGNTTCNGPNCPLSTNTPTYTNVWSSNQINNAMSIWDAILTGSDITTNEDGYVILGNPVGNAVSFTPPTTMWNASSSSVLPNNLAVTTTFNLNTATMTASGYSMPLNPNSTLNNPAPSASPQTIYMLASKPPAGVEYDGLSAYGVQYEAVGTLTIAGYTTNGIGYDFSNGPLTIDMTHCPLDSSAMVFVTPAASSEASGATGSVSCGYTNTPTPEPILSYNSCVNDPNASGGVIAAFTSAPNSTSGEGGTMELACACIPGYIGGPSTGSGTQTLGGVLVGATSTSPNQSCPLPAN